MSPRSITPDMLPAPRPPPLTDHPAIRQLGKALPDALLGVFRSFGQSPVKISLESVSGDSPMPDAEDGPTTRYRDGDATLGFIVSSDRALVHAATELAFGGSGLEPPHAVDRPLSRIEEDLRSLLLAKLAVAAAEPLKATLDVLPAEDGEDPGPDFRDGEGLRRFVVFRFLVNVSASDGELRIGLDEEDLRAILPSQGPRDLPAGDPVAFAGNVNESLATLTVFLAEEELSVAELAALRPGGLLPLKATATAPVNVRSGDTSLFSATLARSGERLAIRISA